MVLEMTYPQLEKAVNPTHDIKLFAGRSNPKLAQEIADYLDQKTTEIDSIISAKKQQLDVLENYKKSLIYEYVTGKKEVPSYANAE